MAWPRRQTTPPGTRVGGRYAHSTAGRSPLIPNSPHFRSRMERNYALFLRWQKIDFVYEPRRFVFEAIVSGRNRVYTPDFYLPAEDVYHETKGWLDRDSQIRLRRMRRYFPTITVRLVPKSFFADLCRQRICRAIEGYECVHHPENLRPPATTATPAATPKTKRRR